MEETRKQERVESRMHEALDKGEFRPYLQPKWNMATDQISGAEALIRWVDSKGNVIPPGEFIPVFEKNGFIEQVDFYMLDKICSYIRQMIDEGREVYPVSINQSRYLLYDPNYIIKVQEIMLKYRVPKGLIELEITETVFFNEKERMLEVMRNLKEFNMNLSIDDFGSGYSSLNLLRDIPFDVLKIDRGFLDESAQSESGKWILRKIVEMADGLNLRVICEGVETHEQVDMLLDIGCIFAQGFLYSRPIPLEEFIEKYNTPREDDSYETYSWEEEEYGE
jgi:EAL domain-containing protein (putative c-di-GMP-specific phosphodiesterase class I)